MNAANDQQSEDAVVKRREAEPNRLKRSGVTRWSGTPG